MKASYGENYEELLKIKQKYDPQNLFHVNHNIAPIVSRKTYRSVLAGPLVIAFVAVNTQLELIDMALSEQCVHLLL